MVSTQEAGSQAINLAPVRAPGGHECGLEPCWHTPALPSCQKGSFSNWHKEPLGYCVPHQESHWSSFQSTSGGIDFQVLLHTFQKPSAAPKRVCALIAGSCQLFTAPLDCSPRGSPVREVFLRAKYWSGLPFSSQRIFPRRGLGFRTTALQVDSWWSEPGKPIGKHGHIF